MTLLSSKFVKPLIIGVLSALVLGLCLLFFAQKDGNQNVITSVEAAADRARTSPENAETAEPEPSVARPSRIDEFASFEALARSGLFVPITYGENEPAQIGEPVEAFIETSSERVRLIPNQAGNFPRVFVDEPELVRIRVAYPEASAGDRVAVTVLDGGELESGGLTGVREVTEGGLVAVDFTPSINPGTHRILLRRAGEERAVDIWVGPDNTYHQLSSNRQTP